MNVRLLTCMLCVAMTGLACAGEQGEAVGAADSPYDGYTLFNPLTSTSVYLVDLDGNPVHEWRTEYTPGHCVYLLENGNLLRCARDPDPEGPLGGGGEGGIIQEIAPDSTVVWEFEFSDETRRHHHDVEKLPNGNVLLIAWERRTREEAIQAGINPDRFDGDEIWPDFLVEIEPVHPAGGKVVWEWHAWDHLVQELYEHKDNYDLVSFNPQLIDINSAASHLQREEAATPENVQRLRALGYLAGNAATDDRPDIGSDWLHTNSVDYNAELDQILLTVRHFSEIWVIDHSTTTEEAEGHTGGRYGRGGDLLYRWGNPAAHGVGTLADRQLFVPHDAQWIPAGNPGAGNITVFNNGTGRAEEPWSSVEEIVPPLAPDGSYGMERSEPTLPEEAAWSWSHPDPTSVYASNLGGAQRLPNGNTLIALGVGGRMLEVGAGDGIVWDWTNPYTEIEGPDAEPQRRGMDDARQGPPGREDRMRPDHGGPPPPGAAGPPRPDGDRRPPLGGERPPGGEPPDGGPRTPGSTYRGLRLAPDHPGIVTVLAVANGGRRPALAPS